LRRSTALKEPAVLPTVNRAMTGRRPLGAADGRRGGSGLSIGEVELARRVAASDAALRRAAAAASDLPRRAPEHILLRAALRRSVETLRDAEYMLSRITDRDERASA
jgi:hypothetical protein